MSGDEQEVGEGEGRMRSYGVDTFSCSFVFVWFFYDFNDVYGSIQILVKHSRMY